MSFNIDIIKITEPEWAERILVIMNDYVNKHYILEKYVPITADIFVFTYPIYLVALYLYGIGKEREYYKDMALYIFFSGVSAILLNLAIQLFVYKQRPEQLILSKEHLIFKHVPDDPFPSDHAAMSATIAMSTLMWWIKFKDKKMVYFSIPLWIFSWIMSVSRIAAWVHWLTDIIFGTLIWIIVPCFLLKESILRFMKNRLFNPLIKFEKILFYKIFGIK